MNLQRVPTDSGADQTQRERAVVFDLLTRDKRYQDFKSPYVAMLVAAEDTQRRALEDLAALRELEKSLTLSVDATAQAIHNEVEEHKRVRDRVQKLSIRLGETVEAMLHFQHIMMGQGGLLERADLTLNGKPTPDEHGRVRREGGIVNRAGALLLGEKGIAGQLNAKLNGRDGVAATLNTRLNGPSGFAAVFDRRVTRTTDNAIQAVNKLSARVDELTTMMRSATLISVAAVSLFGVGILVGVALTRLMR